MVSDLAIPFFYGVLYLAMTQALMNEFEPSPTLLGIVLGCHICFIAFYYAIQKYNTVTPNKTTSINHEVIQHVLDKRMDLASHTVNQMRGAGVRPNLLTYNTLMQGFSENRDAQSSLNLMERIRKDGLSPNDLTYGYLIQACTRARLWEKALELFHECENENVEPNVRCYNSALDACAKGKLWKDAKSLLKRMITKGHRPRTFSYTAVMRACISADENQEAIISFQEMRKGRLFVDVWASATAITAYTRLKQWHSAIEVYNRMLEHTPFLPNVYVYNMILNCYAKTANARRALEVLDTMQTSGIEDNFISYCTVMHACEEAKHWEKILELLRIIEDKDLPLNVLVYNTSLRANLYSNRMSNKCEGMLSLFNRMQEKGIAPNSSSYSMCISICTQTNNTSKAIELYESMVEKNITPSPNTFKEMITVYSSKDPEKAVGFYDDIIEAGYQPNGSMCCALMGAALKIGSGSALELLRKLNLLDNSEYVREKDMLIIHNTVLHACVKYGDIEEGLKLFEEMQKNPTVKPDDVTYNTTICLCSHENKWEEAFEILALMKEANIPRTIVTYNSMMNVLCAANEATKAQELLLMMEEDKVAPNIITYNTVLNLYKFGLQWEQALVLLKDMEARDLVDEVSFLTVMHICARGGNPSAALELFQRIRKSADFVPDLKLYSIAITACGLLDDQIENALNLWKDVCNNRTIYLDRAAYSAIIQVLGKGRFKSHAMKAVELFLELDRRKLVPDRETLSTMIGVYDRLGRRDQSQTVKRRLEKMNLRRAEKLAAERVAAEKKESEKR